MGMDNGNNSTIGSAASSEQLGTTLSKLYHLLPQITLKGPRSVTAPFGAGGGEGKCVGLKREVEVARWHPVTLPMLPRWSRVLVLG